MLAVVVVTAASAQVSRRSGYDDMAPSTRAMQDDDTANPASLWLLEGLALWDRAFDGASKSCAQCHGNVEVSMPGVAARYPAIDPKTNGAVTLEARVNRCRTQHQGALPLAYESQELLALTALLARQSRGLPISAPAPRLGPVIEHGRKNYFLRQGQLNLSCAICHDDNAGQRLAGNVIPQAHPTGYPTYRLEWQAVGSLQRRLRNCLSGMRAETHAFGSDELVALEAFLYARAAGMRIESPAVRP